MPESFRLNNDYGEAGGRLGVRRLCLQYFRLMDHDMYPFPFYFVLIGVPEQLGVLNDLFLIVDKEINVLHWL